MERDIQLLLGALKIYSPTKKEEKLSRYMRKEMTSLGFKNVRTDVGGNAIGEIGSGKPHLLLCGHMDTVPGFLPVKREDDILYGRGAADAKSPMCAMVSAAATATGKLHVTVACVTREEGDSLGVNTLIDAGGDYDAAIFGEPGGASRVAVGYRGRVHATLTVGTRGGHAGSSWAHQSAVDHAMTIVSKMQKYKTRKSAAEDHFHSLDISLTMIRGGSYSNVIPRTCRLVLDVRIPPGLTSSTVKSDLLRIAEQHSGANPGVKVGLEFEEPTEPYEAPTDSLIMRAFQRSILTTLKTKPTLTKKTGTGDMNTLAERMRIPCVTYGPGDSKLEHTDDECIELGDYRNSIVVLKGVFREFSALSSRA